MGDNRNGIAHINTHMNEETRLLVQDFINSKLEERGVAVPQPPLRSPTPLSRKLRDVTCEFERKYRTSLDDMFIRLEEAENQVEVNAHSAFQGVINELFSEGITWSRIVAMFAFAGGLAERFSQDFDQIVDDVTQYIDQTLITWIADNGGWDGFIEFCDGHSRILDDEDRNPAWKKIFGGIAAGVLGAVTIGALLTSRT